MKTVFFLILLITVGGCVGIHTDTQQSKTSRAPSIYYANGTKHFWSKSDHPTNGIVTLESEREWCGVTLWAIIPIPLKLPVCESYTKVTLKINKQPTLSKVW